MRKTLPILFFLCWAGGAAGLTDDEIIDRIYQRVSELEAKYPDTRIRRTMTVRELDPDSGKVRKTTVSEQEVAARVGERPQIKVLSCTVNGASAKPEACERKKRDRSLSERERSSSEHRDREKKRRKHKKGGVGARE